MAQTKVTDDVREVTEVDAAKITTGTIPEARITSLAASKLTGTVDNARISLDAAEIPDLAASKITSGTIDNARISLDAAEIPNLDTAKVTSGTFADARISEASVTQHVTPFDPAQLEMNMAVLAFKVAAANQLAKFSMVDQVIDEYQDATGIDAGNSTNELASGSGTAKYYEGGVAASATTGGDSNGTYVYDGTTYKWHAYTTHGSANFVTYASNERIRSYFKI